MTFSIDDTVAAALSEDLGHGDVTSRALVPEAARCTVTLLAKEPGVLSGMTVFRRAFDLAGAAPEAWEGKADGDSFASGEVVARFVGQSRAVLSAERTALNFLQRLSGVASATRRYADALEGLPCKVCDTRKTTPLLRFLEKEAVRHGGGANHRFNLTDGVLIKENHVAAAGGIAEALKRARAGAHHLARIEIEVRDLHELEEALSARADVIMLDNMDLAAMQEAVRRNSARGDNRAVLEASGNVTLERIRAIAETGVDFVSVGALTHSATAIDLSLLIQPI